MELLARLEDEQVAALLRVDEEHLLPGRERRGSRPSVPSSTGTDRPPARSTKRQNAQTSVGVGAPQRVAGAELLLLGLGVGR